MEKSTILLITWIVLGIHSAYYFIRKYTKQYDLKTSEIPMVMVCLVLPLVTHAATWVFYDTDSKIIIKKRQK